MEEIKNSIKESLYKLTEILQNENVNNEIKIQKIVAKINENYNNTICNSCITDFDNKIARIKSEKEDLIIDTILPDNYPLRNSQLFPLIEQQIQFFNIKPHIKKDNNYSFNIGDFKYTLQFFNNKSIGTITVKDCIKKSKICVNNKMIILMRDNLFVECRENNCKVFYAGKLKNYYIQNNANINFTIGEYFFRNIDSRIDVLHNNESIFSYNQRRIGFNYKFYQLAHYVDKNFELTNIKMNYKINNLRYNITMTENNLLISNKIMIFEFAINFNLFDKLYQNEYSIVNFNNKHTKAYEIFIIKNVLIVNFYSCENSFLTAKFYLNNDNKYQCKDFIINDWKELFCLLNLNMFSLAKIIL